ncbi:uncharacterized protein LOC144454015 [Glandiceps talaboti]
MHFNIQGVISADESREGGHSPMKCHPQSNSNMNIMDSNGQVPSDDGGEMFDGRRKAWGAQDIPNGELTPDDQSISDDTIQQYERENGFYGDNQYDADDEEDTFSEHEHDMLLERYQKFFDEKPPYQLKTILLTESSYLGDSDCLVEASENVDVDVMFVLDNIAFTEEQQEDVFLEISEDFPGFAQIQVRKHKVAQWKDFVVYLTDDDRNSFYLSSAKLQKRLLDVYQSESATSRLDPDALSAFISSHSGFRMPDDSSEVHADLVLGIPCEGWPTSANDWFRRKRNWPSRRSLERLHKVGYHLTAKGLSEDHDEHGIQFRISMAHVEKELMRLLNDTQMYVYQCLKSIIRKISDSNKTIRLALHPYHLKAIFLWACEKHKAVYWRETPGALCVLHLLEDLLNCLLKGFCPNFFIPSYNLYSHVSRECRYEAAREIQCFRQHPEILRDCLSSYGFLNKDMDEMLELHRPRGTLRLSEFLLSLDPLLVIESSTGSDMTTESTERLDDDSFDKSLVDQQMEETVQPDPTFQETEQEWKRLFQKQYQRPRPPSPGLICQPNRPLSNYSTRSQLSHTESITTRDDWAMIYRTFNPYKKHPIQLCRPTATSRIFQPPTKAQVYEQLRKELHRNTTVFLGRKPSKFTNPSPDRCQSQMYDLHKSSTFKLGNMNDSMSSIRSLNFDVSRGRHSRTSITSAPPPRIDPMTGRAMFPTLRPNSAPAKTRWSRVLIGTQSHSINRSITFLPERPTSSLDYGFTLSKTDKDW